MFWLDFLKVKRNSLISYNELERRPHFIRPRLSCCYLNLCRQKKRQELKAQAPKGSVRYRAAVLKYYSMTSRLSTRMLVTACNIGNNTRWTFCAWHSPQMNLGTSGHCHVNIFKYFLPALTFSAGLKYLELRYFVWKYALHLLAGRRIVLRRRCPLYLIFAMYTTKETRIAAEYEHCEQKSKIFSFDLTTAGGRGDYSGVQVVPALCTSIRHPIFA